jgi:hypothetical protein
MNTRTSAYRFTAENNEVGNAKIAKLRQLAKVHNAGERLKRMEDSAYEPKLVKVSVFGRLGKNNPHRDKYKKSRNSMGFYTSNPYQYILKEHAAKFDVYVHNRYE